MLAACIAQMAPAFRVAKSRRVPVGRRAAPCPADRVPHCAAQRPAAGVSGSAATAAEVEDAEAFQPLREPVERALVAYDGGEAFAVTNLVIKRRIGRLVNQQVAGTLATANGDPILTSIHFSLDEDARWHRAWTRALVRHLIDDTPANAEVVSGWIEKWSPLDASSAASRIADDVSRETDSMLTAPPASTAP